MYLYGFDNSEKMFRIPVLKETARGYQVEPTRLNGYRKFIRKSALGFFFETAGLAKLYMRDVLKARVCYAYVALQDSEKKLKEVKAQLLVFDDRHDIVVDATSDEAHINMTDYRVHSIGGQIFVEEIGD